ncbi:MAG TPA: hypothetical protein VFN37_12955 [Candidatus Baltobacteraceae bacterium]|nr:hypothetical protein [Candidatus Baltobacteraceae bacterium]
MIAAGGRISDPAGSGVVLTFAASFFVTGCLLLAFTGPTLGALHAFAAFIVLAITAALNQLLPVLITAPVARPGAVIAAGGSFSGGFALLIAGFYGYPTFAAAGIILGVTATAWVAWNLLRLLAGFKERQTRLMMAFSLLGFLAAAIIGAFMAWALGGLGRAEALGLAPVHAALALAAFATVLVIAISYRFVPMFAVAKANAYGRRIPQWLAALAVVATIAASAAHRSDALRAALALLLISAMWIVVSHILTLRARLRKRIDVSIRYAIAGWGFGLVACGLAVGATYDARFGSAAIIAALLGWLCTTTLGYIYKVAGFLAWQAARERYPASTTALPPLSGAVDMRLAMPALVLIAIGVCAAVLGVIFAPQFTTPALDVYSAGGLLAVLASARMAARYVFGRFTTTGGAHAA